jgi:hypothetical protein
LIPYVPSAIFRSDGLIGDANILIITSVGLVNTGDDGSVSSFSTDSGDPVAAYFTANELNDFVFIVFIHILDNNNDLCIFLIFISSSTINDNRSNGSSYDNDVSMVIVVIVVML